MLARITLLSLLLGILMPNTGIMANSDAHDAVFHIECPPDVTLDCDDEIWDLSPYGWAYVYGYGAPVPASDPVVSYHINSCGTGYITRTWTAYDYNNNPHSCTQYIYVGPDGGFNLHNIHWPPDFMTDDCNAQLHPDDLSPPYDYPTYDYVECSQIMIGYDDLVFNFGGGCKKILRTWSVIDWCQYNPNYPYGGGRWDHTQILKIKPDGPITLNCPDDIIASAGPDCSGTYVSIPAVTGMGACGSGLTVTNNSPYANSNGADASGYYPFGTTYITFTVDDACGNWGSCTMKVTVKDMKKPTPICYNGLTANLMMNLDGYYMDLDAEWFNKGSFDNCTPDHLLQFRIEPSRFTCDDLGRQEVKVYVKDLDGNEQYCRTYVIIQDNMGMCPPVDTNSFTLSGTIVNLQGMAISGIDIELMQDIDMIDISNTDVSGEYSFSQVMNGMDYMIMPRGNDEYALGLSTFDLLKVAKHVHGIQSFQTPGELVAADANQDGQVNIQDLLTLRMLLLNYTYELPNNKAWRFIPSEILSNTSIDILNMTINEYWSTTDLYEDFNDIDFTAIKIGDVNGSVQGLQSAEERSQAFAIEVVQEANKLKFFSTKSLELSGMQLDLNISSNQMLEIIPGKLELVNSDFRIGDDNLLISHVAINDKKIDEGDELFAITMKDQYINYLKLNSNNLLPEIYSSGDNIYSVKLNTNFETTNSNNLDKFEEVSIYPNPVGGDKHITIFSENADIQSVEIFNNRAEIQLIQNDVELHEANFNISNFNPGLYFIKVKTADGSVAVEKLIVK